MDAERTRARGGRSAQRYQLPDVVATYVRDLILSGAVLPGQFLRMEPLAEAVGVSNTPVREGLLLLQSEGLVELVPRRGFVVAESTLQDIQDLFWARSKLAGELAARAATTITPERMQRLESLNSRFDPHTADHEEWMGLEQQFHHEINLAAGSSRLTRLLDSIERQLPSPHPTGSSDQIASARDDHARILEALELGSAQLSRTLIEHHWEHQGSHLVQALSDRSTQRVRPEEDQNER